MSKSHKNLSKEELIHNTLSGMIRKLGPNSRLPTVEQICKLLSVSSSTLDRVLRIMESERLVVRRHGSGIYVSPFSKQRRIGIVFGADINDSLSASQFWSLMHNAARLKAERQGDELRSYLSCPSLGDSKVSPETFSFQYDLESKLLHGIIASGMEPAQMAWLRQWKIPMVCFGFNPDADANVEIDVRENLRCAFEGLRRKGCRRVAVISNGPKPEDFENESDPKTVAFREAAADFGFDYDPSLRWYENTLPGGIEWISHEDAGGKLIRHFWGSAATRKPDGLFFTDDTSAHGGLIALLRMGVKVGKDVQVAVQTNKGSPLLTPFYEEIIRAEIDLTEIVDDLFRLMGQLLQSGSTSESPLNVNAQLIMPPGEMHEPESLQ